MKESITKFDLEAAFKALDEISIPKVGGLKAQRAPLQEVFTRKSRTEALIEEYYDVSNDTELDDAQKAREAEIAAAKLARIEKIVDLDAKTPEELLTSYVGKYIMQCPQCMTLFYKNQEDIEESEDDPTVVNVNEVCQHCGNESGYTLVGKVGAADEPAEETAEEEPAEEGTETVEQEETEETEETAVEEESGEVTDESGEVEDLDLDLDLDIEDDESTQEESLETDHGAVLTESAWPTKDDHRLASFRDAMLDQLVTKGNYEEAQLFSKLAVKVVDPVYSRSIQHLVDVDNIDAPTAMYLHPIMMDTAYDLAAVVVRNMLVACSIPGEPIPDGADTQTIMEINEKRRQEWLKRINMTDAEIRAVKNKILRTSVTESLREAPEVDLEVSESEFEELVNNLKGPVSDKTTQAMLDKMSESLKEALKTPDWMAIPGFEHSIVKTFDDEGQTGYEVVYSSNGVDIVTVEIWDEHDPVTVVDNMYDPDLMQSVYDSFNDFAADLDFKIGDQLREGIFDKFKEKARSLGVKILDKLKSREDKANWILAHAALNQDKFEEADNGDYVPTETNKRFKHFAMMGFKGTYINNKAITTVPSFNNKDLVPGMKRCETREKYEEIDALAKGWSAKAGNGPAFIYLSEDEESKKLAFMTMYFNGDLVKEKDQLEKYFQIARKEYEGNRAIAKAGGFKQQGDEEAPANPADDMEEADTAAEGTEE